MQDTLEELEFEGIAYYDEEHTAIIVGTSGTTGVPKGVCLTDKNLNAAATSHISTGLFEENDVFLDVLLQSIAYGVSAMHYTTCGGLKSVLIPELVSDKLAYLLKTINPDHFLGGPIHCLNIVKSEEFKNGELKPIKNYVSGGATLKKELEKKLNKVSEDFKENGTRSDLFVRQGLGSTENTGGGLYQMPGSYKFGSVGIPLPLNTIGVFTPGTDIELPYNTMGELCITGPCVMKEYLNNEEETNKVLKKHSDGKVWLHMGDIGYIDKDGCFFHKHRLSDIFMRRGFNVHPGKITELLNTIPEIKAVGVIVVEHPIEEMVPIACISLYNEFDNDKVKEKIENKDYSCIISVEEIFKENDRIDLKSQNYSKYVNGVKLDIENCKITEFDVTRRNVKEETQKNNLTDETCRIYLDNKFLGLGIVSENKLKRDLLLQD